MAKVSRPIILSFSATFSAKARSTSLTTTLAPSSASLGNRGQTSYAAASAAIEGFTKALAVELGRYNINVNCVAPDFIDTEMTRNTARKEGMYLDDFKRFALAQIPLRRMGTVEDVANVVLFLVCDESSFISGQTICVRGGP